MSEDSEKLLLEFPILAAIAMTAFAAALVGTVFGLSTARRLMRSPASGDDPESTRRKRRPDLISWTRLSKLEDELDRSQNALEALRRDYELDTGLLKQEIQRLELLLGRFAPAKTKLGGGVETAPVPRLPESRPGYHSMKSLKLVDPLRTERRPAWFAPLATSTSTTTERVDDAASNNA